MKLETEIKKWIWPTFSALGVLGGVAYLSSDALSVLTGLPVVGGIIRPLMGVSILFVAGLALMKSLKE
jgi:hypothetical protein